MPGPGPNPAPDARRRLSARATFAVYKALATSMQRLPEPLAAGAASLVGLSLTAFRADARSMYGRHLRRVMGSDLTEAEVRAWTRRAFVAYARYWLEGARLPHVDTATVQERMFVVGLEHLRRAKQEGRGSIIALPHVGSWEWGGAWLALNGFPMTAVAEPLEPPEMFDWFVEQRRAIGLTIVPLDAAAGSVVATTLRANGVVGLLCDRDIQGTGVEVEFFGEKTTLPAGPATLALRTGAALLPTAVYSGPGRDHTGLVLPPVEADRRGRLRDDVTRVTQDLAAKLESLISRAPEQWHLFQPNWPSDYEVSEAGGDAASAATRAARSAGRMAS